MSNFFHRMAMKGGINDCRSYINDVPLRIVNVSVNSVRSAVAEGLWVVQKDCDLYIQYVAQPH
jgi:hypothetical protein